MTSLDIPPSEIVLFHCPSESYVYQVPPAGTLGHRAELWHVDQWLAEVSTSVLLLVGGGEAGANGDHGGERGTDGQEEMKSGGRASRENEERSTVRERGENGSATSGGAEDWTRSNEARQIHGVKVASEGLGGVVRLRDATTGELFAEAPLTLPLRTCVEPVIDSSRYFCVRVVDPGSGNHAFIGLGFRERAKASDFMAALDEYARYVERQRQAEAMRQEHVQGKQQVEAASSSKEESANGAMTRSGASEMAEIDEPMHLSLSGIGQADGGFVSKSRGRLSKTFSLMFGKDGDTVAALAPSRKESGTELPPMGVSPTSTSGNKDDVWGDFASAS